MPSRLTLMTSWLAMLEHSLNPCLVATLNVHFKHVLKQWMFLERSHHFKMRDTLILKAIEAKSGPECVSEEENERERGLRRGLMIEEGSEGESCEREGVRRGLSYHDIDEVVNGRGGEGVGDDRGMVVEEREGEGGDDERRSEGGG